MSTKMGRPTAGPALRDADALHLAVLGPPVVRWGERVVAFRTRKEFALLVYLVLMHIPQPREHLAALLWPDRDAAAARNLLRTTLSRLRQHLAAAGGTSIEAITLLRAEHDALGREVVGLARDGTPSLTLDAELVEAGASPKAETAAVSELQALLQAAAAAYRREGAPAEAAFERARVVIASLAAGIEDQRLRERFHAAALARLLAS